MNTIAAALVRKHEGYRQFVYKCSAGKLTIGIGLNIEDEGLTEEEAIFLMQRKLIERERALKEIKGLTFTMLSQYRQAALLDMAYQLGVTGLLRFANMWSALAAGQFKKAAAEALDSLWAKQTPSRAKRIAYILENDRFPVE